MSDHYDDFYTPKNNREEDSNLTEKVSPTTAKSLETCSTCVYENLYCNIIPLCRPDNKSHWRKKLITESKNEFNNTQNKYEGRNNYHKIAKEIADLVEEKNKAYGNAAGECHIFLELCYPNGVPVEAYKNMLFLVRLWDKIKRIATDKDAFGEMPEKDIIGYCLQKLNNELIK